MKKCFRKGFVAMSGVALLAAEGCTNVQEENKPAIPDEAMAIAAFQHVAAYTENLWKIDYIRDESQVPRYTLPEIKSKTAEEWEKKERPELLKKFKHIMYGDMPGAPDEMRMELLAQRNDALNGLAIRKEIRLHFRMKNGRKFDFDMMVHIPKHVKTPPPVFVGLNFSGNQANTPDLDVRMTRQLIPDYTTDLKMKPRWRNRAVGLGTWNYIEAMKRGYAVATAAYSEVCPDQIVSAIKLSGFSLFYDPKDLRSEYEIPFAEQRGGKTRRTLSVIGAWAWGLSRILDALEKEPLVDAKRAMVIGHSRNGKAALWAGVCDPRFSIVFSNNSGHGGAALTRRNFGENLRLLYWEKRSWFSGNLVDYVDHPEKLPIDQHQLLALIAPRRLYVASATKDIVADFRGEFLAAQAASKVWHLYGKKGLELAEMPKPDQSFGDYVGYHIRTGKHDITPWDWEQYYNYADKAFGGKIERMNDK